MRRRTTFTDLDTFDVAAVGECLFYGPKTAEVLSVIRAVHADIQTEREEACIELSLRIMKLRRQRMTRQDAIATVRRTDPELWSRCFPSSLDRTGFTTVHAAAVADTQEILDAMYAGKRLPFTPCRTPVEAFRRYQRQLAA